MARLLLWNFDIELVTGTPLSLEKNNDLIRFELKNGGLLDLTVKSTTSQWKIDILIVFKVNVGVDDLLELKSIQSETITSFKWTSLPLAKFSSSLTNGTLSFIPDKLINDPLSLLDPAAINTLASHLDLIGINKTDLRQIPSVGFDFDDRLIVIFNLRINEGQNKLSIREDFKDGDDESIFKRKIEQVLVPVSIGLLELNGTKQLHLNFKPSSGRNFLYLNPYILHTETAKDNLLAYQYCLVNGVFRFETSSKNWFWVNGAVLLLNYADQNGNPVVLRKDKVQIIHRVGNISTSSAFGGENFEMLSRGLTFTSASDNEEFPLDFIAPRSINNNLKNKQLYQQTIVSNDNDTPTVLGKPFWISSDGTVKLTGQIPSEFYGLTKGTIYKPTNKKLSATIATENILRTNNDVIYHATSLRFDPIHMQVMTLMEEKESSALDDKGNTSDRVALRVFDTSLLSDHDFPAHKVPASNYRVAAANVHDPKNQSKTIPIIPKSVGGWINQLQENVSMLSAGNDNLKHESGFLRLEAQPVNPSKFFQQAPKRTRAFADTAPANLELVRITNPAGFVHGSKSGNDDPFGTAKKYNVALNNLLATPENAQIAASTDDLVKGLRRARRFWNESASAIEPQGKIWKAIKFYLQRGPEEFIDVLSQGGDLSKLNDIREQFGDFLGTNSADNVLNEIRQVVKGNLNAVNGLGSRLRLIVADVNELTSAKLQDLWNKPWSALNETEKTLSELLNYYYYPLDRKAITDMAKLLAMFEDAKPGIETEVRNSFQSIDQDFRDALEDIDHMLRHEIDDLLHNGQIEVKRILSEAWIDVDSYVIELEKIWNQVIPETNELNQIKNEIRAIAQDLQVVEWTIAKNKLQLAFRLNDVFAVIEEDAEILWNKHINQRITLAEELFKLYTRNFLEELKKVKMSFGAYFNPLAYKKILEQLQLNITSEITFLKDALRKKIVNKFKEELLQTLKADIASFEEDILILGRQAKLWKNEFALAQQAMMDVLNLKISDPDVLVQQRLKALLQNHKPGFEALRITLADYKNLQLSQKAAEIDAFVTSNRKKINDALILIQQIGKNSPLNVLFNEVKGIATEFSTIAKILTTHPEVALDLVQKYLIHKYELNIRLEDLRLQPPEYIVYGKNVAYNVDPSIVNRYNGIIERLFGSKFTLASFGSGKKWNMIQGEASIYIVKLGNNITLPEIIEDIEKNNAKIKGSSPFGWTIEEKAQYLKEIPDELKTKFWRGVFIVKPLADISKDKFLSNVLGLAHFRMSYAAIGGEEIAGDLNVYARIKDKKDPRERPPAAPNDETETEYTVTSFDAVIKNSMLVSGEINSVLVIAGIMGKRFEHPAKVIITGSLPPKNSLDETRGGFELAARLESPLELDMDFAFFKKIIISRIRATSQKEKCYLEIDAMVSFKEFAAKVGGIDNISLKNFRIEIPSQAGGASVKLGQARKLQFDMEAIEFILSKPRPLQLLGMELLPTGLGYTRSYDNSFNKYMRCFGNEPKPGKKFAYVKLNIEFGNLTSLGSTDGQSLQMSGVLGFQIGENNDHELYFGISGGEFTNIDINLFRFIELRIKELNITNQVALHGNGEQTSASVIYAQDVVLRLLNWPVFGENGKISVLLLNEENDKNRKGFYFFFQTVPDTSGLIRIHWALISRGIVIPNNVLTTLLTLDKEPGALVGLPESDLIKVSPGDKFKSLAFANDNTWLLGASFGIGEIFERCTLILHDKHYYGIMLMSKKAWFTALFGGEKIALAYMPGRTKKEDRFRIEMPLPFLNFFGTLKTGMLALEIGVNKDFLFDLGYPWRVGNRYEWARAFSSIQGITEIKFGIYFEKRTEYLSEGNGQELTIGAGIGLYYGYYVGGRTPIAWAEAGVGLFVILAGQATFRLNGSSALDLVSASLVRIEVIGVIGIYAYAQGGVDYWVISATFRVEIQAAIAGHLIYLPQGGSSLSYDATLSARFSASARVKLGFFKVTVRVAGSVDLHVGGKIALN